MKGPLGLGLEIPFDSTHKVLFVIRDNGILPLLDLLELFEQLESIKYFSNKKIPHFIFEQEIDYVFCNDPEFYIYWEISENYEKTALKLGLSQLRVINQIFLNNDK